MNEIDPPITVRGLTQAANTGKFLKKYFSDYDMKFDQVVIKTSPFIRTIMTATQIAKELGISKI